MVSSFLNYCHIGKIDGILVYICGMWVHRQRNEENKKDDIRSNSFILTVSDNGVGISRDLDIKDLESLGIQLIKTLVDQLDGKLELKNGNGTEFSIRFTIKEENN
jgi:two-component sensor histidine kinase